MARSGVFKTGFCHTGDCDRCPREIVASRTDKQGTYLKQAQCGCLCHTEKDSPW